MKRFLFVPLILLICSFVSSDPVSGTWQFAGGIYNGKNDSAPSNYYLQKKYKKGKYDATLFEPGQKPVIYESGSYELRVDTCIDTETYSLGPSKITNIPIHYLYTVVNDTLKFKGTLPSGMQVEEFWVRVK